MGLLVVGVLDGLSLDVAAAFEGLEKLVLEDRVAVPAEIQSQLFLLGVVLQVLSKGALDAQRPGVPR